MLVRCPGTAESTAGGGRGSHTRVYEGTHRQIPGALAGGRETPPTPAQGTGGTQEECLAWQATDLRGERPCILSSLGSFRLSLDAAVFLTVGRVGDGARP